MKNLLLVFLLFTSLLNAQESVKKVVFDLTTGSIEVFEKKVLSGISFHKIHYENNLEELKVAVIVHGDAYKFFIKNLNISRYKNDLKLLKEQKSLSKRLKSLADIYEVEFLICESGVNKLKINKNNLYKYTKLVATATVGLIEKQSDDYVYVPIFK